MGKWIKTHPAGAFLRDCLTPSLRGETTLLIFSGVSVSIRTQLDRKRPQDSDFYFWTLEERFLVGDWQGRGVQRQAEGQAHRAGRDGACCGAARRHCACSGEHLGAALVSSFLPVVECSTESKREAAARFVEEVVCRINKRNKN